MKYQIKWGILCEGCGLWATVQNKLFINVLEAKYYKFTVHVLMRKNCTKFADIISNDELHR